MGSPPACKRGRLHRQGCSHRLSRRNPGREKAGRGARHRIPVRRQDSFLDPGRETDCRPFKSLAQQARHPAQGRSLQADRDRPPADARRARKATANRILTMLKAALNRAFHTDRVPTDMAWRKVKPFKRVDEAVVRYLTAAEARRLVKAGRPSVSLPGSRKESRRRTGILCLACPGAGCPENARGRPPTT